MAVYDEQGRELLTTREAKALYGVAEGTLRSRVRTAGLTRLERGGRYYYLAEELAILPLLKSGRVPLQRLYASQRRYIGRQGRQVAMWTTTHRYQLQMRRDLLDYSTRFAWDAHGNHPDRLQLAVAILADAMEGAVGPLPGFEDRARAFEREVISKLPETFELPVGEVREWLSKR